MTVAELRDHCHRQQGIIGPQARVLLVLRGRWGKSNRKRLFGRHGGPLGTIVAEVDGGLLVDFFAGDVLAALPQEPGE
jgi:hypothetical protein